MISRQQRESEILTSLEDHIGVMVEEELSKRAQVLPTTTIESVVNDLLKVSSINRSLNRVSRATIQANQFNELVNDFLHSQVYFAQSVILERDLLKVSQAVRQNFGIEAAISLLENIVKPDFNLEQFLAQNATKGRIAQDIQLLIVRIQNFYKHADIKKNHYLDEASKSELPYHKLMESLMWINGQRTVCITGLKNVLNKSIPQVVIAKPDINFHANGDHAARAHLQIAIGIYVDEELAKLHSQLATANIDEVMKYLQARPEFQSFLAALNNPSKAGLDRLLPNASMEELNAIINAFLHSSIHLAQSVMYERSVVRISQYVREYFGIDASVKLLNDIEKPSFNLAAFFHDLPSEDIARLINNIHQFYLYANIKEQDGFFDPKDEQGQKLFESRMWLGLQRRCCIQGMKLIESNEVYEGKQIELSNLDKAMEVEIPAKVEASTTQRMDTQPMNFVPPNILASALTSPPSRQDPYGLEAGWDDADMEEALRRSLEEAHTQARPPQRRVLTQQQQREQEAAFFAAAKSGDYQKLIDISAYGINVNAQDGYKKTALMIAASEGNLEAVKCLVDVLKVNVNESTSYGFKAIHCAAFSKKKHVMAYLISKGAKPVVLLVKKEEPKPAPVFLVSLARSPTLFSVSAKSAMSAFVTFADGSLVSDVKKMLDLMKAHAEKMAKEKDYAPYGTSDEDDRMYNKTHYASVKKAESGLSEERFYLAAGIIESLIIDGKVLGDTSGSSTLNIQITNGTVALIIRADYDLRFKQNSNFDTSKLPAPISQVPFDAMKLALDKLMSMVFDNWQFNHPSDPSKVMKRYANSQLMSDELGRLYKIEKIVKGLDSHFSLGIKTDNRLAIAVDKEALDKGRNMLFSPVTHDLQAKSGMQLGK